MAQHQDQKKYLVYNETRKEAPKSGRDTRTTAQKVGHSLSFVDHTGVNRILVAGGRPVMVDKVPPGLFALAMPDENGDVHVRIREVDNIVEALKEHAAPVRQVPVRQKAFPEGVPPVGVNPRSQPVGERQAKAVEMGQDTHQQRGGSEHEGAVNPDGDPNFLVRAPSGNQHGRRSRKKDGAVNLQG
jgi:hypothetical protein